MPLSSAPSSSTVISKRVDHGSPEGLCTIAETSLYGGDRHLLIDLRDAGAHRVEQRVAVLRRAGIDVYGGPWEKAGPEGFGRVNDQLTVIGPEVYGGGVGRIFTGQHSLLSEPETEIAAKDRLIRGAVDGQVGNTRNAEHREWLGGELVESGVVHNGRSHAVRAENDDLLDCRIIDGLRQQEAKRRRELNPPS